MNKRIVIWANRIFGIGLELLGAYAVTTIKFEGPTKIIPLGAILIVTIIGASMALSTCEIDHIHPTCGERTQ